MRAAIINENYEIEKKLVEPTTRNSVDNFLNQISSLVEKINPSRNKIECISIAIPGKIRWDGFVYELPNIGIKNIPLAEFLNRKFGNTVYVNNDAEMAGLGEAILGSGKEYKNVFFFTISTGVGGAYIQNKRLKIVDDEIGHTLVKYKNENYEFEKLFSGTGILNLAKLNGLEVSSAYDVFLLKQKNDEKAVIVYNDWIKGVSDLINFVHKEFQAEIIVLSGGVINASDLFLEDLKASCKKIKISLAKNLQDAGLIGTAFYGFNPQK